MQQNARQMFNIVRRTFPTLSFDEQPEVIDCTMPGSEGEELKCLWSAARASLEKPNQSSKVETILAFTSVGIESVYKADSLLKPT